MSKYKHILLATDLVSNTDQAAKRARGLADLFNAKLSLIHVVEPIPAYGYPEGAELESPYIDEAEQEMAKLAKKLSVEKNAARVEFGSVKTQVLSVAEELGVDLIVVGSHGRHGLSRLLGSTASGVVHGAQCDVLTVRYSE